MDYMTETQSLPVITGKRRVMPPSLDQLLSIMEPIHAHPVKSGPVFIQQRTGGQTSKLRVILTVYTTRFEHYAVISQERILCKDSGFINLKHCKAQKLNNNEGSFEISLKDGDLGSLTITPVHSSELKDWISAVNSESQKSTPCRLLPGRTRSLEIPRTPLMPTLAEEGLDE